MGQHTKHTNSKGQIIIELLIAFGLAGILLPALLTGLLATRSGRVAQEQRIIAVGLLREGEEAVRSVRDAGWDRITSPAVIMDVPYHWVQGGSEWTLVEGGETVGDFTRSIVISDISPADPSLKIVTIAVSWGDIIPSSTTSVIYLTSWKNISLTDSGTVQPQGQGFQDWCHPALALTNIDLDRQGHPTSLRAFETADSVDGNGVLAGTGANSSGPAFSNIKFMGNEPPAATILGDYNGTPQVKVNGLFGNDHYAFLATDSRGVEILDIR